MALTGWADDLKRRLHNRDVRINLLEKELSRALRALKSSRATLRYERTRGAEAAAVLESLTKFCREGYAPNPGFVAMHCRVAAGKLGREL